VGAADFVGVAFGLGAAAVGLGVAARVGVGAGVGAVMTSGDGTGAGELTTAVLAGATLAAALFGTELAALVGLLGGLTTELNVAPADDGWLLVHAAKAAAQTTATTHLADVGLVVRSRLAMHPG
jgi:hypothetical protein